MNYVRWRCGVRSISTRLFLSWCHTDEQAKSSLVALLRPNLRILSGIELVWWEDSHIMIGADWRREILSRLAACDYGVLLLSPDFFASDFITGHELPRFVGELADKGALPVGLKRVPLDGSRTLFGVDRHQVFTLAPRKLFFTETQGPTRERFAQDLATAIRDRVLGDS